VLGGRAVTIDVGQLLALGLTGVVAGTLGALLGIGGGLLVIPALVLGFGIPIHAAVASSLAAVVATSSAASSVYVGEGLTNLRLGMTLEVASTTGAIVGGLTATLLAAGVLLMIFAVFLLITAILLFAGRESGEREPPQHGVVSGYEEPGRLAGAFVSPRTGELVTYRAGRIPLGLAVSFVAGDLSGLLGVGGGFLKVPAMRLGMEIPTRVAAATSNLMIGVTAAASLIIYVERGFLVPLVAAPIALGVVAGALAGTRVSARVSGMALARILAVVLIVVAIELAVRAAGGSSV
jgi:uncharacterized membrane protein YfcA